MLTPPRYSLDISAPGHAPKKFKCPSCGQKRFVRFIDTTTRVYLDAEYGRCDREEHCGYFRTPYADGATAPAPAGIFAQGAGPRAYTPPPAKLSEFVPLDTVRKTLTAYAQNSLVRFLTQALGPDHTAAILSRYFIGTARDSSALFWQIDKTMRARTAAKILYLPDGHRDKNVQPKRTHTTGDGFQPCLFGEHLLYTVSDSLPVALVESEKTAAICSAYLPRLNGAPVLWMACSGAHGLTEEKARVLAGHRVILIPDFSFHARATWGMVPMRKKANAKGIQVPHPEGELQPDFVSRAALLRAAGAEIVFFDAAPHLHDASDIADLMLAQGPPPPLVNKPDFSRFVLPESPTLDPGEQTAPQQAASVPKSADPAPPRRVAAEAPRSFKIGRKSGNTFFVVMDSQKGKLKAEAFINRPSVAGLIDALGMFSAELVDPLDDSFERAAARTAWERDTYRDRVRALALSRSAYLNK